jgi:hypothetical protein
MGSRQNWKADYMGEVFIPIADFEDCEVPSNLFISFFFNTKYHLIFTAVTKEYPLQAAGKNAKEKVSGTIKLTWMWLNFEYKVYEDAIYEKAYPLQSFLLLLFFIHNRQELVLAKHQVKLARKKQDAKGKLEATQRARTEKLEALRTGGTLLFFIIHS